jgi:integrase
MDAAQKEIPFLDPPIVTAHVADAAERVREAFVEQATIRDAWIAAASAAGLLGFQLRDFRHEAACRFEEAGTPVGDVSKLLGHTSLTTTSRYLMNTQRPALRRAVDRLERHAAQPRPVDETEDDDLTVGDERC